MSFLLFGLVCLGVALGWLVTQASRERYGNGMAVVMLLGFAIAYAGFAGLLAHIVRGPQ
jgi:hypothetical protein